MLGALASNFCTMSNQLRQTTPIPSTSALEKRAPAQQLVPGLVGMSPRTNSIYYLTMHEEGDRLLGAPVTFRSVMTTPDFGRMIGATERNDLGSVEDMLVESAQEALAGGADFIVILSNTGSSFADALSRRCGARVLGIVEPVLQAAKAAACRKVGLLSTLHTARSGMYCDKSGSAIEFIPPSDEISAIINRLIVTDIALGKIDAGASMMSCSNPEAVTTTDSI